MKKTLLGTVIVFAMAMSGNAMAQTFNSGFGSIQTNSIDNSVDDMLVQLVQLRQLVNQMTTVVYR